MDILTFFVAVIVCIGSSYYAWLAWLKPSKITEIQRQRRALAKDALPLLGTLLPFHFFDANPEIDIWILRLFAPIGAALSVVGVYAAVMTLTHGSNVSVNPGSYPPLFQAVQRGDVAEANRLLRSGELLNQKTVGNQTPLHIAAAEGQDEMVAWLLAHEADPLAQDEHGKTPINFATSQGHRTTASIISDFMQLLRSEDNELKVGNKQTLRGLLAKDVRGYTLLHLFAQTGATSEVIDEIALGADVNSQTANNITPLHKAIISGNVEICRILIKAGADVNARDVYNNTPLYYAVLYNNKDLTILLLDSGADATIQSVFGNETPLDLAAHKGYFEISALLKQK